MMADVSQYKTIVFRRALDFGETPVGIDQVEPPIVTEMVFRAGEQCFGR